MINEALDLYGSLRPKNPTSVARFLARRGLAFDKELLSGIRAVQKQVPKVAPLAVYCAEALTWTRHAKRTDDFIRSACIYMVDDDQDALDLAVQAHWRFGPERLATALNAMREFFLMFDREDLPTDLEDLRDTQETTMEQVVNTKEETEGELLFGLGPWLFLAPFKIHVTCHPELWNDPKVDGVTMPLGTQVVRALKQLSRDGIVAKGAFPEVDDDDDMTGGEAFASAIADVVMWQGEQRKLADLASSHVPHINSALYELGYRGP